MDRLSFFAALSQDLDGLLKANPDRSARNGLCHSSVSVLNVCRTNLTDNYACCYGVRDYVSNTTLDTQVITAHVHLQMQIRWDRGNKTLSMCGWLVNGLEWSLRGERGKYADPSKSLSASLRSTN